MSPLRKPDPVPEGLVTDEHELSRLVHGDTGAWEGLGHPEMGGKAEITAAGYERARVRVLKDVPLRAGVTNLDEEIWSYARVDAWREAQHRRLRYLLLHDLLGEPALTSAHEWKRNFSEQREWRQQ